MTSRALAMNGQEVGVMTKWTVEGHERRTGRKGGTVCEAAATAAQLIRVTQRRVVEEVVAAVRLIRLA